MDRPAPNPVFRNDYLPPAHLVETVDLHFDLYETRARVTARSDSGNFSIFLIVITAHLQFGS